MNFRFELPREEVGTRLNYIKDAPWKLGAGVDYSAKAVDSKPTERSERSNRAENEICDLFAVMKNVAAGLEKNKANALQSRNGIASLDQKLEGVNGNIRGVSKSVGSVSQKYTESKRGGG